MISSNAGGRKAFAWIAFAVLASLSLIPPLSWISVWFLPIPLIVFTVTHRLWLPAVLAAVFATCLTISGYGLAAWMFGLAVFFIGWTMGDSIQNRESPYAPLVTGTIVVVMLELILLALLHWFGYNLVDIMKNSLQSQANNPVLSGVSQSSLNNIVSQFTSSVRLVLPGAICIWAFVIAALNLLAARVILHGVRLEAGSITPQPFLSTFRLPYGVAVLYMITIGCVLLGLFQGTNWMWQFVNSAALVAGFLMGVQGLSYLWRKLQKTPARWWILMLLIVAGIAIRIVGQIYILIGLLHMLSYARRRDV